METAVWKKYIATLIIVVMVAIMTGCGDGKNNRDQLLGTNDMVYKGTNLIMDGMQGEPILYIVQNQKIYVETCNDGEEILDESAVNWEKGQEESAENVSKDSTENETLGIEDEELSEEGDFTVRLYSMNLEGEELEDIKLPTSEKFDNFVVGRDGSIVYLTITYDVKKEKNNINLVKIGTDGREEIRENISDSLAWGQFDDINGLKIDAKGNILISGAKKVFVLDENLKCIGEVKSGVGYLIGMALTRDGQIICAERTDKNDQMGYQVHVLDVEGKEWGEAYPLEDVRWTSGNNSLMDGSGDYDFYYEDDSGIYGYDMEDKTGTKLMDFLTSNIDSEHTYDIIPTGDGRFIGTAYTDITNMGNTGLVIYSKVDPSTITDRKIITYGGVWIDEPIRQAIIEFNKENEDYQIEIKDYSNEEEPWTKMTADIIAGNVPDIIDLAWIPEDQYIAKGVLEDLTPYFEKDQEIRAEDMIPAVWDAIETNGKHYYIAPGFNINSLIGKSKDVGTNSGWTYDELKEILKKEGEGIQLLSKDSKSDMLSSLLRAGVADFVNWNTGECSFDSQDFKDILEICNEYSIDEKTNRGKDMSNNTELFVEGKQLLLELDSAINIDMFLIMDMIFDEDITYVGYPNKDRQGSYFTFNNRISIYAKSDRKEGAWEFIRTFMTKEYQGKTMYSSYTPTRQDCLDLVIEAAMTTKEYTNELGIEITPRFYDGEYDGFAYDEKPMTKEQEVAFRALINNTKRCEQYDSMLLNIIQEESRLFFTGEKRLDETAEVIQNRITTYVNEYR